MKKEDLNKFREFLKTPKGKAAMFFAFYFVFFIIVGGIFSGEDTSSIDNSQTGSSFDFNLESITNDNFSFNYEVVVDAQHSLYSGKKYSDKEEFDIQGIKYYKESDNYFINNNGVWIKTENPYLYSHFYNSENILALLTNASYVSKTEYDSGKLVYIFSIASATINKVLENEDLDVEEIPNEIVVSVDENGYANAVKFKLDSYCKIKNICTSSMIIDLNYDNYGNVEEIISPLG